MIGTPTGIGALNSARNANALAKALLDLGPVAMWRLDEKTGVTAVDATGHGHDGTYISGVGTYTLNQPPLPPSGEGRSVYINDQNSLDTGVTVPDAAALRLTTAGTLVAWTNVDFGWWNPILAKDDGTNGFAIYSQDGEWMGLYNRNAGVVQALTNPLGGTGRRFRAGRWDAGTGKAAIFVDGVKTGSVGAGWNGASATAAQVEMGFSTAGAIGLVGFLAFQTLYDYALTDGQMAGLWRASR
jgi:hypothetical protein